MSIFPTKILLATDGSREAELAARTAADLGEKAAPPERSAPTSSCIPLVTKKGMKTPKPTAWSFVWKPVCHT